MLVSVLSAEVGVVCFHCVANSVECFVSKGGSFGFCL